MPVEQPRAPEPVQHSYIPSYPVPIPTHVVPETPLSNVSVEMAKAKLDVSRNALRCSARSLKIWSVLVAVLLALGSFKLLSNLGPEPEVLMMILGLLSIFILLSKQVRFARKASNVNKAKRVKKLCRRSL
jgi:hypothetical protein